jgi:hypothetical protein
LVQLYDHWTIDDLYALPNGGDLIQHLDSHRWSKSVPVEVRNYYEPNWREREAPLDEQKPARMNAMAASAQLPPFTGAPDFGRLAG